MEPSFTRPPDRHRLPAAVPLVSLARRSGAPVATAALAYFRSGSAARCSRLVDGSVGPLQRVEVSQYRLATHLVLALVIFAAIIWTLRRIGEQASAAASSRLKITALVLLVLTFLQLCLGALVAGLRAGRIYNT